VSEKDRKKIRKISKYARDLCYYATDRRKCVEFYLGNPLSVRTYFEIYAHSASLLTILDMLKRDRISVQEAKEFFGSILSFFFYYGSKFTDKYIVNGNIEVKDFGDLERLDQFCVSLIVSYMLLEKLGKDKIIDLTYMKILNIVQILLKNYLKK
jgi:hypothetical protein